MNKNKIIGIGLWGLAVIVSIIAEGQGYWSPLSIVRIIYFIVAAIFWDMPLFGVSFFAAGFSSFGIWFLGVFLIIMAAFFFSWKYRDKIPLKVSALVFGPIFILTWVLTGQFPWMLLPFLILGPLTKLKRRYVRSNAMWKILKKYGGVTFLRRIRKSHNKIIRYFIRKWKLGDPYLEGELPFVFRDLRVDYMSLMNYQTRLHTYYAKKSSVTEAKLKADLIQGFFGGKGQTYESRRNALDKYRFKGKDQIEGGTGWSNNKEMILHFFEQLKKSLNKDELTTKRRNPEEVIREFINSNLNNRLKAVKENYDQFITNVKRFGLLHRFKSLKMHTIDLVALYGVYKHYYIFANENSLYELWDYDVDKGTGEIEDEHGKKIKFNNPVTWDAVPLKRVPDWEDERDKEYNARKEQVMEEIRDKIKKRILRDLQNKARATQLGVIRDGVLNQSRSRNFADEKERDVWIAGLIKKFIEREDNRKKADEWSQKQLESKETQDRIKEEVEHEFNNGRYTPKGVVVSPNKEEDEEVVATYESEIRRRMSREYKLGFADDVNNLRHEVDVRGFVLADIHRIEVDHVDKTALNYIRRVRVEDFEDFPQEKGAAANWVWVYSSMENEWNWFLDDLRMGLYHPFSRTFKDYADLIRAENLLNMYKATRNLYKPGVSQNPAFDYKALAYPGLWVYWGKRNYWDSHPEERNPYTTLSTFGLSSFLEALVKMRQKQAEIHNRFLKYFVYETGSSPDVFTNLPAGETGNESGR